eukprot:7524611-Ditylum_brightwellii.AAC.1
MYNTLLDVFQGLEHDEDTMVNATAIQEQLKFNRYTKDAMLPSLLHAKVDHASFNTWKALSENDRKDWPTMLVIFLRAAEKNLITNHDTSSKFRTANQRLEGRKSLNDKEKKIFKEACEKGEGAPGSIWHKLTGKEKSELTKAKREKKAQNNGGLGS